MYAIVLKYNTYISKQTVKSVQSENPLLETLSLIKMPNACGYISEQV